jgi:ACS family pantothenate transporter-like MFS transporter
MKEDLHLYGNQLNYFTTYFKYLPYSQTTTRPLTNSIHSIGYIVMLYISCFIISHIDPSIWLPSCELLWGITTCILSTVTKDTQVYGLRFLVGFFEGCTWPVTSL